MAEGCGCRGWEGSEPPSTWGGQIRSPSALSWAHRGGSDTTFPGPCRGRGRLALGRAAPLLPRRGGGGSSAPCAAAAPRQAAPQPGRRRAVPPQAPDRTAPHRTGDWRLAQAAPSGPAAAAMRSRAWGAAPCAAGAGLRHGDGKERNGPARVAGGAVPRPSGQIGRAHV